MILKETSLVTFGTARTATRCHEKRLEGVDDVSPAQTVPHANQTAKGQGAGGSQRADYARTPWATRTELGEGHPESRASEPTRQAADPYNHSPEKT